LYHNEKIAKLTSHLTSTTWKNFHM